MAAFTALTCHRIVFVVLCSSIHNTAGQWSQDEYERLHLQPDQLFRNSILGLLQPGLNPSKIEVEESVPWNDATKLSNPREDIILALRRGRHIFNTVNIRKQSMDSRNTELAYSRNRPSENIFRNIELDVIERNNHHRIASPFLHQNKFQLLPSEDFVTDKSATTSRGKAVDTYNLADNLHSVMKEDDQVENSLLPHQLWRNQQFSKPIIRRKYSFQISYGSIFKNALDISRGTEVSNHRISVNSEDGKESNGKNYWTRNNQQRLKPLIRRNLSW